jgi:DNA-binding response OmpR family regulator
LRNDFRQINTEKVSRKIAIMKLLIVEDEQDLLSELKFFLEKEGWVCETTPSFEKASEKLHLYSYDILLVDITLPDGSGLKLIEAIKNLQNDIGIIIISAKNSLDDKVLGLNLGADDYLTKPFFFAELNSRIKAIYRRRKFGNVKEIQFQEIKIIPDEGKVRIHQTDLILTKKEYALLLFFITNAHRLLTKEAIAEHLWGDNIDSSDSFDFIYTHINNLRRKILQAGGKDYIQTIYGMGYRFEDG